MTLSSHALIPGSNVMSRLRFPMGSILNDTFGASMKEKDRCSTCGFSAVNFLALIKTEPETCTPVMWMARGGSDSSFRAQRAFSCTTKSWPA